MKKKEMDSLPRLVERLESAILRVEGLSAGAAVSKVGGGGAPAAAPAAASNSPAVQELKQLYEAPLRNYLNLSNQIGGLAAEHAKLVEKCFDLQLDLVSKAASCKKPNDAKLGEIMQPLANQISASQQFRERNRADKTWFNHLSAISESICALGWVSVAPTPAPYIEDSGVNATQFYTNRILKDFRDKDKRHVDWARAWLETLKGLQAYVKKHHTTGLAWNMRGGDIAQLSMSNGAVGNGAAPPPPPGPPPPPLPAPANMGEKASESSGDSSRAALFASINVGSNITSGLKKVSADQQTHKNPNLRVSSKVPDKKPAPPPKASGKADPFLPLGAPKVELVGKKWQVENHVGNKNLVIADTEMQQVVYVYRCTDCVIQVKGKINSIILDSCKKSAVVFENLVSALEFVNCRSVQAQVTGLVRTVSIEKTDGAHVFLSKQSATACEIVSAKSSEMNISIPDDADGQFREYPVPEQFKTVFDPVKKTLKTESNESMA